MIETTLIEENVESQTIKVEGYWVIPENLDTSNFDFTWQPDPYDPPYIHQFGTQWQKTGGPKFIVKDATDVKYHDSQKAIKLPDSSKFNKLVKFDIEFDYSWHPDDTEPDFVWVFGSQFFTPEELPVIEYKVKNADCKKFVYDLKATLVTNKDNWVKLVPINEDTFDWSWHPHPWEPLFIYVWGNDSYTAEELPTLEYRVPGAIQRKYMTDQRPKLVNNKDYWKTYQDVDASKFDFEWTPPFYDPPFIYTWGNKWISGSVTPTIEYKVPGAVDRKFMGDNVTLLSSKENWSILIPIDESKFDFSWRPDPGSPPYIYVFGNQWHDSMTEPTVEYHVEGATDKKYITDILANVSKTQEHWKTLISIDNFDYSWRPNPHSQPYIYVFGNQWHDAVIEPTVEYHQPGATDRKYVSEVKAIVKSTATESQWKRLISVESFDYSWRPDPGSPPYIYVFGNKWNDATTEPTIEYHCEGATDKKYVDNPVAIPKAEFKFWKIFNTDDLEIFDFTWRPNPHSPPQIYQWEDNGPTYTVEGSSDIVLMKRVNTRELSNIQKYYVETTLEDLIKQHPNESFWALNKDLHYDNFDFNWRPNETNFQHLNVFGTALSKDTKTYFVNATAYLNGFTEINYVELKSFDIETKLDIYYIDMGNTNSQFETLKQKYPWIQKTRFVNSWVDTITRCARKSSSKLFWVLSSHLDYSNFKFDFYPSTWQMEMIHVFGTQWNHWGDTYLINSELFEEQTKFVKIIEHLLNINHIRTKRANNICNRYNFIYVDHNNTESSNVLEHIKSTGKKVYSINFDGSYLSTLKKWVSINREQNNTIDNYYWVVSSLCNYEKFDFTWLSDPFQNEQLHVFASEFDDVKQKYGDTFLINIKEFEKEELNRLEDYSKQVNYISHISAKRINHPIKIHKKDSQVDAISMVEDNYPYTELINISDCYSSIKRIVPSVWDDSHNKIIVGTKGASQVLVPRIAKSIIQNEIYDYSNIEVPENLTGSKPLDIIFISNGEPIAEQNYEHLNSIVNRLGIKNTVKRIKDVNGRVASQHAAAKASSTSWYFLVNGKVRVSDSFDWSWQPDRLQKPKHYIFTVTNPVNGLEYGHQAIVANNKLLTLNTQMTGLDFTLDSLHEVVDMNCGVALYNTDAWTTWRTAFRESIKLRSNPDEMSKNRLMSWTNDGSGDYADISKQGALDGIEYYESVNGEFDKLLLTYDWDWIRGYYNTKYGQQ